jgi:hypothetical protein
MSAEAFERFHVWKNTGAVLKLSVLERGNAPQESTVQIATVDEESHQVGFIDPKTRSLVPISFQDAVYIIGKSSLEAVRPTGEVLITEEYSASQTSETPVSSQTHFDLRFNECRHRVTFPLKHSTGHIYCYVCQPHLQKIAVPGNCPDCDRKASVHIEK